MAPKSKHDKNRKANKFGKKESGARDAVLSAGSAASTDSGLLRLVSSERWELIEKILGRKLASDLLKLVHSYVLLELIGTATNSFKGVCQSCMNTLTGTLSFIPKSKIRAVLDLDAGGGCKPQHQEFTGFYSRVEQPYRNWFVVWASLTPLPAPASRMNAFRCDLPVTLFDANDRATREKVILLKAGDISSEYWSFDSLEALTAAVAEAEMSADMFLYGAGASLHTPYSQRRLTQDVTGVAL